jgi:hypothetical protein
VIGEMFEALKGRIQELGFGELLLLKIDKLDDRTLGLFCWAVLKKILWEFRLETGCCRSQQKLFIKYLDYQLVESLPNYNDADKRDARADLRKLCEAKGLESMFTRHGGNYAGLGVSEVPRWFIEHYANAKESDVDDWTVQSFLMLVFNALLFPTGSDKIVSLDYLMSACLSDVPEINWCQAIVDDIKVKARDLKDKMSSNDNSTPNVQGCIAFLVVSFCQVFLVCLCLSFIIFVVSIIYYYFQFYVSYFIFMSANCILSAI